MAQGEGELSRLQSDRGQWVEADERRHELDRKLARLQADLTEAQRAEALAQKRDSARERHARLKRAAELTADQDELQRELPANLPLARLRTAVGHAQSLEFELSELQAEIDTAAEADAIGDPDLVPPRPMRWLGAAAALVLIGWLGMYLLRDSGLLGIGVVAVLAVGVLLTLLQAFRQARKRRIYGLAMQLAQGEVETRREHLRARQEDHRRKRRELETTLEAIGVRDIREAETTLATTQEHTEQLAQIDGELRGLGVEERSLRRLEDARDDAADESERADHALATMGSLAEDPERKRAELEREIARAAPARDAARSEADQAQGRADANQVDAELVASLAERLAAARDRYAEFERRVQVYEGTLAAIDAAEATTLKTAARYLEERMGPTISGITDGRYDDIEVDEKSLAFRVRAPETGELVDVDRLSQGTADQLFLAARLGLVRLVTLDRRPPLILDDPFVTFDAGRSERALRLIRQMAHDHDFQVLYLTCSDRFDAVADELVVLDRPSDERVLAHQRPTDSETASQRPSEAPQPTLRFEPDPRPNPDPVAPRRVEPAEDETVPLFADAAGGGEVTSRLAGLRASRAAADQDEGPDPIDSLRRSVQDAGEADPFSLGDGEHDEDRA